MDLQTIKADFSCIISKEKDDSKVLNVFSIGIDDYWARFSTWKIGDSSHWIHQQISLCNPKPKRLHPKVFMPVLNNDLKAFGVDRIGFCAVAEDDGEVYHVSFFDSKWRCLKITDLNKSESARETTLHCIFYTWNTSFHLLVLKGDAWMDYSWKNDSTEPISNNIHFADDNELNIRHVTCCGSISAIPFKGRMHFFFRGTNGIIYECIRSEVDWRLIDLTKEALRGSSITKVRPSASDLSVVLNGDVIHIFFIGIDSRLRELYKLPSRGWRHVSLRRHVGGSVCNLPPQSRPYACLAEGCLHVFFINEEHRIGECFWKMKRNKWRVIDTSELIPRHASDIAIFSIDSDEGPHIFFSAREKNNRNVHYHLHWTNNIWNLSIFGNDNYQLENEQKVEEFESDDIKLEIEDQEAAVASSSSQPGIPLPPPPPPRSQVKVARVKASQKPPLVVKIPMKDGKYKSKLSTYEKVRLVVLSDTHNYPERVGTLPEGDILVHCGDFTVYGKGTECLEFANWLDQQNQFKHKIVIAGNHEVNPSKAKSILSDHCIWLENNLMTVMGINFYGTSWGCDYGKLPSKGVDVLLTHKPPKGHGDIIYTGESRGSQTLLDSVNRMKPILHIFGHNHEGFGATCDSHTVFVNAATCLGSAKSTIRRNCVVLDIYPGLKSKYGKSGIVDDSDLSYSGKP